MRINIGESNVFKFIVILSGMMIVGRLFDMNMLTSISFYLSFICVLMLWVIIFRSRPSWIDLMALLITVIAFVNCLISIDTDFSFDYFEKYIMFASSILFLSICPRIRLIKSDEKILHRINLLLFGIVVVVLLMKQYECFYFTNTGVAYLTMGFTNPNTTALFLTCIVIYAIVSLLSNTRKLIKLVGLVVVFVGVVLIVLTKSRTALLILTLFVFFAVLSLIKKKPWFPKNNLFCVIISVFPFVFAMMYQVFMRYGLGVKGLDFLVSEGKVLTSRQSIWEDAFLLIRDQPIVGNYGFIYRSNIQQMHNSHLDVAAAYGLPVLLLVCVLLYFILKYTVKNNNRDAKSYLSTWGFVSVLLLGIGEAALFSGGLSFYLLVGGLATIANQNSIDN